jgi:hypothetical protein
MIAAFIARMDLFLALQYKKIKVVEILAVADKTMKYGLPKNLNNTIK